MAVIGRRLAILLFLFAGIWAYAADPSSAARSQVSAVAEALSAGDATQAISRFAKSYPDYVKLRRDFEGLTAFQIENQLAITDENDTDKGIELTITWDITITGLSSDETKRRTGEIHATVARVDGKWRIVTFAPLEIFNPQIR